jgi:hypothetical protein
MLLLKIILDAESTKGRFVDTPPFLSKLMQEPAGKKWHTLL